MKDDILKTVTDLVSNFLCYDRQEDEDLPEGAIEEAIEKGSITIDDIVAKFREDLEKELKS